MNKYVVIVAGGKGLRMGGDLPKQFIPMRGKPLLMHTLETFYRWDASVRVVLVLPEAHQAYWRMLCEEIGCQVPHAVVNGGEARFFSVKQGLDWIIHKESMDGKKGLADCPIAVHDGVRPFVAPEVISSCFERAASTKAAIPVVPLVDSLREKDENGSHPVDRSRYIAVQTPQVFDGALLQEAYRQPYSPRFTDDASVVEALGYTIDTVPGNRENIKITTPFDLRVAEALFNSEAYE